MGLNAALTDRARALQTMAAPQRIEGKSLVTAPTPTRWFRARLDPGSASETADGSSTERMLTQRVLIFGIRDLSGDSLIARDGTCMVKGRDRVEVDSPRLGRAVYELTGDPVALSKKRRVIGFTVSLQRVDSEGFERKVL